MKVVTFVLLLDVGVRLRHDHRADRGEVVEFVLQLETLVYGQWLPVVRFDSAHGKSHRHVFRLRGEERREALGIDFADALTFAEVDLREHWRTYVEEFLK